ncbi:hypothetical protein KIW84_UN0387 [Lathyrus oleraceus]|nr:hypothetical protein KIW84_UN0385 [Pisum sativum]KAI5381847.1 hypothetical protein KIW84_UN0387 [Pisum sativum]
MLAIAYGNSSDSEEDDQSDSDIAVDGDDLNTINHPLESKSQESPCLPSQFQGCQAAIPPVPVEIPTIVPTLAYGSRQLINIFKTSFVDGLPAGSVIGTASLRRKSQIPSHGQRRLKINAPFKSLQ